MPITQEDRRRRSAVRRLDLRVCLAAVAPPLGWGPRPRPVPYAGLALVLSREQCQDLLLAEPPFLASRLGRYLAELTDDAALEGMRITFLPRPPQAGREMSAAAVIVEPLVKLRVGAAEIFEVEVQAEQDAHFYLCAGDMVALLEEGGRHE